MRRKAQAAMEFLMTYGWAILVVLAAIGALAYLGILNPENWGQGRCFLTGDFNCQDWDIAADGTFRATLLASRDSKVLDVKVESLGSSSVDCDVDSNGGATVFLEDSDGTAQVPLANATDTSGTYKQVFGGQRYSLRVDCQDTVSTPAWVAPTSGAKFDATMQIRYVLDGSSITKTLNGEIKNIKVS